MNGKSLAAIAAGAAVLAGIGALYGLDQLLPDSNRNIPYCKPDGLQAFSRIGPGHDYRKIAEKLGVTIRQVEDGELGTASCDRGIPDSELGSEKVIVLNIGGNCLASTAVFTGADNKSSSYKEIVAICANDGA